MKKLLLLCTILISTVSIGQNIKALDKKYGFRDAIFEMPFESFNNLEEYLPGYYNSKNENLSLGKYALTQVDYGFYKGKLSTINIDIKGEINGNGILEIFQAAYGNGLYQKKDDGENYIWSGNKVSMVYSKKIGSDRISIYMWSNKLEKLREDEKNRANIEAAKLL